MVKFFTFIGGSYLDVYLKRFYGVFGYYVGTVVSYVFSRHLKRSPAAKAMELMLCAMEANSEFQRGMWTSMKRGRSSIYHVGTW